MPKRFHFPSQTSKQLPAPVHAFMLHSIQDGPLAGEALQDDDHVRRIMEAAAEYVDAVLEFEGKDTLRHGEAFRNITSLLHWALVYAMCEFFPDEVMLQHSKHLVEHEKEEAALRKGVLERYSRVKEQFLHIESR